MKLQSWQVSVWSDSGGGIPKRRNLYKGSNSERIYVSLRERGEEKGGLGGMNLIACVDSNWAISNKGEILVSIPADKKLFKELTDGKVVVGDRRTMESIPGGTTLGGRTNIILTSDQNYSYGNAKIVHDMDEAMEELKNYADEDIFVVGGEKVYKEFFPYCERAYITKVDYEYQADAYLENLEESDEWIMTHDSDEWTYYDLEYYFYQYKRI